MLMQTILLRFRLSKFLPGVPCVKLTVGVIASLMLSTPVSQAGVMLDGVAESQYTSYASQPQFAASGRLGTIPQSVSGTLIAPDIVISAAHNGVPSVFQPGGVGPAYTISQVVMHPTFIANGSNLGFGFDIAVYKLSEPVVGVTPASIYRGTTELGLTSSLTGFGFGEFGSNVTEPFFPTLPPTSRAGTNVVDQIYTFPIGPNPAMAIAANAGLVVDFDAPSGIGTPGQFNTLATLGSSANPTSLEYHLAGFDSGGGVYIFENSQWWLAGINSGVTNQQDVYNELGVMTPGSNQNFGYGAVSILTRISSYQDFIDTTIASFNSVPEPSSLLLIALGSTVVLVHRQRRWSVTSATSSQR